MTMFAFICELSSRRVLANSTSALRVVVSKTLPQSSLAKMLEIFWNSEENMPSIALAYVPIALVPWRYGSSAFLRFEVLIVAIERLCRLLAR